MERQEIQNSINENIETVKSVFTPWLHSVLEDISDDWWQECVLDCLSPYHYRIVKEESISTLSELSFSMQLHVFQQNFIMIQDRYELSKALKKTITGMLRILSMETIEDDLWNKASIINIFQTIMELASLCSSDSSQIIKLNRLIEMIELDENIPDTGKKYESNVEKQATTDHIDVLSMVTLVSDPSVAGVVLEKNIVGGRIEYTVFTNNERHIYYDGQIQLQKKSSARELTIDELKCFLTSYQINNPSGNSLYSLNSARIDFVPYQFRPALKIVKATKPRILIADSVGVGKTIEAGIIMKELEARKAIERILIICPKPLVTGHKWRDEMHKFDEDFAELDSKMLKQIIYDCYRDEEWPERYNKAIIPYSILNASLLHGEHTDRKSQYGLDDLDISPRFDLIIVDEAHHIRNSDTQNYEAVKYFCDRSEAVVFLTATPLQTGDKDLFTLLNVLRPDIVTSEEQFERMAEPNKYINAAAGIIRSTKKSWQSMAIEQLKAAMETYYGKAVLTKHSVLSEIIQNLKEDTISREKRIEILTKVEDAHTFANIINRTRRNDIEDFCTRVPFTLNTAFTDYQENLYQKLLTFEHDALAFQHGNRGIKFMMTTITRQAASCIFGLAPSIQDMLNWRIDRIMEDPDIDFDSLSARRVMKSLMAEAQSIQKLASNLPEDDPKFDSMYEKIAVKQKEDNNKIILFSTFKHTLNYIQQKLLDRGIRAEQINGDIGENERELLNVRFKLPKDDPKAIDILLFTEVGGEGLDYQFCNTMINYDLPWNPMRIEQRIGRIDRRGQTSNKVYIFNMITDGTIDAEIYYRCLSRIGVFNESIGECEAILGEITNEITDAVFNTQLSEDELNRRLEKIEENNVRKVQEMNRLEKEEKNLFGLDISQYSMNKQIQSADNIWLSSEYLERLVVMYLDDVFGRGNYIRGTSSIKTLLLNKTNREKLREETIRLKIDHSDIRRVWLNYLKGAKPTLKITFDSESSKENRDIQLISTVHPLVKIAAAYFDEKDEKVVSFEIDNSIYPAGVYHFQLYSWHYTGIRPHTVIKWFCDNEDIQQNIYSIVEECTKTGSFIQDDFDWNILNEKNINEYDKNRDIYKKETERNAFSELEGLKQVYLSRRIRAEQDFRNAREERIVRMKARELQNLEETYESDKAKILESKTKADIFSRLLVKGKLTVNKG